MQKSNVLKPGITAVILAAGDGQRFGGRNNKVLHPIDPKQNSLQRVLQQVLSLSMIHEIRVVIDPKNFVSMKRRLDARIQVLEGRPYRMASVQAGLQSVDTEWVLLHDGSRPCVRSSDWQALIEHRGALSESGAILVSPVRDSLGHGCYVDAQVGWLLDRHQSREGLWHIYTPQIFPTALVTAAVNRAIEKGEIYSDESAAILALGHRPRLVEGYADNIKLTFPKDARVISDWQGAHKRSDMDDEATCFTDPHVRSPYMPELRVGQGFDVHRYSSQGPIILGGLPFDTPYGLMAHSDGDVVLHAVMDALLGACGLGDIGIHFPCSDPKYRGIDSQALLSQVLDQLHRGSWVIQNLDLTIVGEKPFIAPKREALQYHLANQLRVAADRVNIKATTTEGLGALGRGEGLSCWAIVLVQRNRRIDDPIQL